MKFVQTDKEDLLEYTTTQVQNILGAESLYEEVECFFCTIEWQESVFRLNLVQAILLSMHIWCEGKQQDYHRHFNQVSSYVFVFTILFVYYGLMGWNCGCRLHFVA